MGVGRKARATVELPRTGLLLRLLKHGLAKAMKPTLNTYEKVLEAIKYCVRQVIDERELMFSPNMRVELLESQVRHSAFQLSETVYGSAWRVQVVKGPVLKVPISWVDMLQLRVKYCDSVLLFFLWPLVWLFFHKRKVQYREVKYPDIEFKARELFPQFALDRPNIVVCERPRFTEDFSLFEQSIIAGATPSYHEEPAYVLCRHCNRETELKEILRPQQLVDKQMERSKYMGPVC